ncbi:DUF4304 domain-containing protein [Chitinophaga polysaccharea]|uniref:DUF4304 domain-containing protein n=1 Tax=Chitinophaga polysaccharea TaxID=1293035 RepID=UPI00115A3085|nr:DUF4304 domain-containing protein [Chitinophaga polysaccharea]
MDKFNELISLVGKHLKAKGWVKKSNTFYLKLDNNWGLINFQSSSDNSPTEKKFTINLGVSSTVIRDFDGDTLETKPNLIDCHWSARIGHFMEDRKDTWWTINQFTDLDQLSSDIIAIVDRIGIATIKDRISDSKLIDLWSNNETQGSQELKRLTYLTILLRHYKMEDYSKKVSDLIGYGEKNDSKYLVNIHLKQLDEFYGIK